MAAAVRLRAQLLELGYPALIMSPEHLLIARPEDRNRFVGYTVDQARQLLEECCE